MSHLKKVCFFDFDLDKPDKVSIGQLFSIISKKLENKKNYILLVVAKNEKIRRFILSNFNIRREQSVIDFPTTHSPNT